MSGTGTCRGCAWWTPKGRLAGLGVGRCAARRLPVPGDGGEVAAHTFASFGCPLCAAAPCPQTDETARP